MKTFFGGYPERRCSWSVWEGILAQRATRFGQVWGNLGKNLLHPPRFPAPTPKIWSWKKASNRQLFLPATRIDGAVVAGEEGCYCTNAKNNTYWCVRVINSTHNLLYCEFITGFIEFYDLNKDPHQVSAMNRLHSRLRRALSWAWARGNSSSRRLTSVNWSRKKGAAGQGKVRKAAFLCLMLQCVFFLFRCMVLMGLTQWLCGELCRGNVRTFAGTWRRT